MTPNFEKSRSAEILNAAFVRNGGKRLAPEDLPLEAKCLLMLGFKGMLYSEAGELMSTPIGEKLASGLNTVLLTLCPEAFKGGSEDSAYARMSKVFWADIKDIKNGRF